MSAADVHDSHGAKPLLHALHRRHPSLEKILGDQLYGGPVVGQVMAELSPRWAFETVRKPPGQKGFAPLPRRWVVERTFAWISRCRRMGRDFERYASTALAFAVLAMVRVMIRRLARNASRQTDLIG